MNIDLSKIQRKHLKAIEWFISDNNRREGRSYLLAIAYINKAVNSRGQWIQVLDHFPTTETNRRLFEVIEQMISKDKQLLKKSCFNDRKFIFVIR